MPNRYTFVIKRRPNFEAIASAAWILSAIALIGLNYFLEINLSAIYYVISPTLFMIGAYRGFQSYKQYINNKEFTEDQNIEFITYEELKKKSRKDSLWLGKGFAWTPHVTQVLYDEFLRNPEILQNQDVSDPSSVSGAYWLHSLDTKEKDIYKTLKDFEGHTIIPGTTGAGKTRTIDIIVGQLLMRKDEPLIFIDPKNDNEARENIRKICEREGRDFYMFHPGFPDKSVRIDALHSWDRVTQISDRIKAILPSENGNDPFSNIIWNVVNALASTMVLVGERPNIVRFRSYMSQEAMDDLIIRGIETYSQKVYENWRELSSPYFNKYANVKGMSDKEKTLMSLMTFYQESVALENPNLDLNELINIRLHNREHLQKLIASLFPVLSMLSSGGLDKLLSPEPDLDSLTPIINTQKIVDDKAVLWMGLDTLSDQTVGSMIGSIILSDLTSVAGSRYNFGTGSTLKINLVVDESAEVINPPMIQLLNKARGSGFRCFLLAQTFADLSVRLGDDNKARMAIGNINNSICLRLNDMPTAEYFSEKMPEVMVKKMGVQYQTNISHDPVTEFGGRYGESIQEEYLPMIPAWAYTVLPNFHYIGSFTGGSLVKGRLPILRVDENEKK